MEKLEVVQTTKKEVATYNENKFVEVGQKFATDISLPKDYDVVGSMKALHLMCLSSQSGDLTKACTPVSIEMAIREVLQKGLNPIKKQCYPVKMGDKLVILESYQGKQRSVYSSNRHVIEGSINAQVIYKNDKFVDKIMPDGRRVVVSHTQAPFGERSEEIIGAYATVMIEVNGKILPDTELMTMNEIKSSWAMSRSNGDVHKRFPVEMAKKTIVSRLCKRLYGWTDESSSISSIEDESSMKAQPSYDIPTNEENPIIVEGDSSLENEEFSEEEKREALEQLHQENEVIIEDSSKNEDGTYVVDYKTYLKIKPNVEKVSYDNETKKVTVRDLPKND